MSPGDSASQMITPRETIITSDVISSHRNHGSTLLESGTENRVGVKNVKQMLRDSARFSEGNSEQIERIRLMHDRFAQGSEFSFNYNTLLVLASILAGLGLVSDSSTAVVASVFVSPRMGPVVGIAYGATIRDYTLCKTALKTELIGLLACFLVGAIVGACDLLICRMTSQRKKWNLVGCKKICMWHAQSPSFLVWA